MNYLSVKLRPSFFVVMLVGVFGCSGEVVIVPSADQGGTGSGAGTPTGGSGASGSGGVGGGAGGTQIAACNDFCEAVADVEGCPSSDHCASACVELFGSGCVEETEVFLACVPPFLQDGCIIGYPSSDEGCLPPLDALQSCISGNSNVSCKSTQTALEPGNSCSGEAECGPNTFEVSCDAGGACLCQMNGLNVGVCQNLLNGIELCGPFESCCRTFFGL